MIRSILFLLLSLLPTACRTAATTKDEDVAILRAVLAKQCERPSGEYFVLASETQVSDLEKAGLGADDGMGGDDGAVSDLLARNRASSPLPAIGDCSGIRTASESEIAAALLQHPHDENRFHMGWEGFYAHFPKSLGVLRLSLPGYSNDRKTAVVTTSGASGTLFGSGFLVTLKKSNGTWQIVSSRSLWVA
jgi:hypothetical protein